MEYGTAAAFSRKLANGHGHSHSFGGKSVYDGIFAAPARRKSSVVDYGEIFSGSDSSIPILEVPELDEEEIGVNVRRSELDYSKVFGGFEELDFAVSHDELLTKPQKRSASSSEEWGPHKSGISADVSPSRISMENQFSSPEASHVAVGTKKQFKMSYNLNNSQKKRGTNGTAHIAQLKDVPGYTHIIDDTSSLQAIQGNAPMSSVKNKTSNCCSFKGEDCKKEDTEVPKKDATSKWRSKSDGEFQYVFIQDGCPKGDIPQGTCETDCNLNYQRRAPRSSLPPNLSCDSGIPERLSGANLGVSSNNAPKDTELSSSPPYFDEETDANSAAAASAAALKKAIEEAQAKINVAKEMMGRKKEGFYNGAKSGFYDVLKAKKRREYKAKDGEYKCRDKDVQNFSEEVYASCQSAARTEEQYGVKAEQVTLGLKRRGLFAPVESTHQIAGENSKPTIALRKEEAETFKIVEQSDDLRKPMQSENECRWEEKKFGSAYDTPVENINNIRSAEEPFTRVGVMQKMGAVKDAYDKKGCSDELKSADEMATVAEPLEENREEFVLSAEIETCESVLDMIQEPTETSRTAKVHEVPKTVWKPFQKFGLKEQKEVGCLEREEIAATSENRPNGKEHEIEISHSFVQKGFGKGYEEFQDMLQFREEHNEEYRLEEDKKELLNLHCKEVSVRGFDELLKVSVDDIDSIHNAAGNSAGHDRIHNAAENSKGHELSGGLGHEVWSIFKQMYQTIEIGSIFKQMYQTTEIETEQQEICSLVESGLTHTEIDQRAEAKKTKEFAENHECCLTDSGISKDDCKQDETETLGNEMDSCINNLKNEDLKVTPQELADEASSAPVVETKALLLRERIMQEPESVELAENQQKTQLPVVACSAQGVAELGSVEQIKYSTWAVPVDENEMDPSISEFKCEQKQHDQCTEETSEAHAAAEDAQEQSLGLGVGLEVEEVEFKRNQYDQHAEDSNRNSDVRKDDEELSSESKESDWDFDVVDLGKNQYDQTKEDTNVVSSLGEYNEELSSVLEENGLVGKEVELEQKQCNQHREDTNRVGHLENDAEESRFVSKESDLDIEEFELVHGEANNENNIKSSPWKYWDDNVKNVEADQSPPDSEDGKTIEAAFKLEIRQSSETIDDRPKKEKSSEHSLEENGFHGSNYEAAEHAYKGTVEEVDKVRKDIENKYDSLTKEGDAKHASHKEVESGEERSKKMKETKEKEREREKERIMVERAIREARERAFAEACERAERAAVEKANTESRRKVQAEARGKSAKVSVELNNKSSADKVSIEARIRAERAAVERALAEARERALEKALSEKAASQARQQGEKSVGSSRDSRRKQDFSSLQDAHHKGSGPSKGSNHKVSSSSERPEGADEESMQRCKARFERNQRTTERAAKALAEKKMRDFIAQKEQTERHRLAETVDAEVKRWSSGKEGNLRALLSTLQYILRPESGWKPIPLTELISTASIKKAYRKATLYVHPDKLQQRGAGIQQKYICEKVFDLLKEAWNKFNMEER